MVKRRPSTSKPATGLLTDAELAKLRKKNDPLIARFLATIDDLETQLAKARQENSEWRDRNLGYRGERR